MFRLTAIFGLIAMLAACNEQDDGAAGLSEEDHRALLGQRETVWLASYGDADATRMEDILAEGFTITFPNGRRDTREDLVNGMNMEGREAGEVSHYTENRTITINGDTAILSGVFVSPGRGQRADIRMLYTDTWIWRDGEWKVLASQLATAPQG